MQRQCGDHSLVSTPCSLCFPVTLAPWLELCTRVLVCGPVKERLDGRDVHGTHCRMSGWCIARRQLTAQDKFGLTFRGASDKLSNLGWTPIDRRTAITAS